LVSGYLPDKCTEIYNIIIERNYQDYNLIIQTRCPVDDSDCPEVEVPFVEMVDLDVKSLGVGSFNVYVNGFMETFTLGEYVYRQDATVESLQVFVSGSKPVQVNAIISGFLPNLCTELYDIIVKREDQDYNLILQTRYQSIEGIYCPDVEVPFVETVMLDVKDLTEGTYDINAGDECAGFTLEEYDFGQEATVESLKTFVLSTNPAQVQVQLLGYLPDPCTELFDIIVEHQDRDFTMTLHTRKYPSDYLDATMLFGKIIELDVKDLKPGTYTVSADGLQDTFTL